MERNEIIDQIRIAVDHHDDISIKDRDEILEFIESLKKPIETPVIDLLTNERREDMLVGALEGGSNYWYTFNDVYMIAKYGDLNSEPFATLAMKAVSAGESIPVYDREEFDEDEDECEELGYFNLESIRKGEALMRSKAAPHWWNILGETDDAETADVWFQYCVLGDIVYS